MSSEARPASVERFMGFAEIYDRARPHPPEALGTILAQLAGVEQPALVIDLGCGTGLATRYWAERAGRVIGIDSSPDMLHYAQGHSCKKNISYLMGYSYPIGLPAGCADIITVSQAFHWMEPEGTLAEVARLLRPGGVFAALDFDFPPIFPAWEAEFAYQEYLRRVDAREKLFGVNERIPSWSKSEHLRRMQGSNYFRFTREFYLHHMEMGNAERLVLGALSYGLVQSLLKAGVTEHELGLDTLRAEAEHILGKEPKPWYWSVQVRVGVI